MAETSNIADQVKRRIAQDSGMSTVGVKQLLEANPITNPNDRKLLASVFFYLYGRVDSCPPPLPPPKGHNW